MYEVIMVWLMFSKTMDSTVINYIAITVKQLAIRCQVCNMCQ